MSLLYDIRGLLLNEDGTPLENEDGQYLFPEDVPILRTEAGNPIFNEDAEPLYTSTVAVVFAGYEQGQSAMIGGQLGFLEPAPYVMQPPRVRARVIDLATVVRMAEGADYQQRLWYPVYQFGGGLVRRYFVEPV